MLTRRTLLVSMMTSGDVRAGGLCFVSLLLDGRPARLLLDTGAQRSLLSLAAVRRLGLRLDPWVGTTLRGAGGRVETHQNAIVRSARFGGVDLYQAVPGAPLSLAVTTQLLAADGLLGGDVLKHTTLGVDAAAGVVTLAAVAPRAGAVPLRLLWPDQLLAPVEVDGVALTALVDTGAAASLMNARGLYKLGRSAAAGQPGRTMAIGGALAVRRVMFRRLQVGAVVIQDPVLLSAPVPERGFDMILGMDVLGRQRVVLSYGALCMGLGRF